MTARLKAALNSLERAVWVSTDDDPHLPTVLEAAELVLEAAGREKPSPEED